MFNLREEKGSYKGIIGECMFFMKHKEAASKIFYSEQRFFKTFSKYPDPKQYLFLKENYYSIDAIEINDGVLILYEIKTENYYNKYLGYKPKVTSSVYNIFEEARTLGFETKLAIVKLFDNWKFDVREFNFIRLMFSIDKPKKFYKH